jgi:hypothetical protein
MMHSEGAAKQQRRTYVPRRHRAITALVLCVSFATFVGIVTRADFLTNTAGLVKVGGGDDPKKHLPTASSDRLLEALDERLLEDSDAVGSSSDAHTHPRKSGKTRWVEELLHLFAAWNGSSNTSSSSSSSLSTEKCDEGVDPADCSFCAHMQRLVWERFIDGRASPVSPALRLALHRQRAMHTAVETGSPEPGQKYIVWSLSGGLGNRFQSLASTFVAALLSRRVLLLKDWFMPLPPNGRHNVPVVFPASVPGGEYTLEPLQKLFWDGGGGGNTGIERAPRTAMEALLCPLLPMMSLTRFRRKYPQEFGASSTDGPVAKSHPDHIKIDISARHDKTLARWNRFLCSAMNETGRSNFRPSFETFAPGRAPATHFFHERFVYVWTNQYYLPVFFANPAHADEMTALFPEMSVDMLDPAANASSEGNKEGRMKKHLSQVYNLLVKLLVIPARQVMASVAKFSRDSDHALSIGHHVSLQVRAFQIPVMENMARGFHTCLSMWQSANRSTAVEPIFLASMHAPVRHYFARSYAKGMVFALAPPTGEQGTGRGPKLDQDALADLMLLSLSTVVFISPGSTFGSFVGAFGDIRPRVVRWYLDPSNNKNDGGRHGTGAASLDVMCPAVPSTQPCFGAWFKYDHLFQRSSLGSNATNRLSCVLRALPPNLMHCSRM